jgi:hypothetical protein
MVKHDHSGAQRHSGVALNETKRPPYHVAVEGIWDIVVGAIIIVFYVRLPIPGSCKGA